MGTSHDSFPFITRHIVIPRHFIKFINWGISPWRVSNPSFGDICRSTRSLNHSAIVQGPVLCQVRLPNSVAEYQEGKVKPLGSQGEKVIHVHVYTIHAFSYNIRHRNFVAISKLVQWLAFYFPPLEWLMSLLRNCIHKYVRSYRIQEIQKRNESEPSWGKTPIGQEGKMPTGASCP